MLNVIEIHRIKDFIKSKRLSKYEEIAVVKKRVQVFIAIFSISIGQLVGSQETERPHHTLSVKTAYI